MKVANIIEEGKLGGPQIRMVRVAAALRKQCRTLIIMPKSNSIEFRNLCHEYNVAYRAIYLTRITKEIIPATSFVLFSLFEIIYLTYLLKRERIDLVHVSGGSWQYKGVISAILAGKPFIWHLNDTYMPKWLRSIFGLLQPLADGLIFASHRSKEYYAKTCKGVLAVRKVIPSSVDLRKFNPQNCYEMDHKIRCEIGSGLVIGTVANINPIKGLETSLRVLCGLKNDYPDLKLLIVGPVHKNQRNYYYKLIQMAKELNVEKNVVWAGLQTDVRAYLKRMDIYLCTSKAESSPVAVWEAMSMARPIVSTDVGDVSRHIKSGTNGYIVRVGDDEKIVKHLRSLIESEELRQSFGDEARAAAMGFSPDTIAKLTFQMYECVLSGKSALE